MNKNTRRRITGPDANQKRVLRLAQETVRTLGSRDLTQVVGGCNTTSWSTEAPPNTQLTVC